MIKPLDELMQEFRETKNFLIKTLEKCLNLYLKCI